ncbi:hypothetical protein [Nostoc sp.]|uniref:hypothetical protein n=1 Tax=Nostoc sp. TaxID=1180 RepID=UPI002FF4C158
MAYKDISRGVRLAADHAKYITWLQKDTEGRQAAYAAITTPANRVKLSEFLAILFHLIKMDRDLFIFLPD